MIENNGAKHMSYKPEVIADKSGKWVSNQLRFATEAEALAYVFDLANRWTLVGDTRVITSEDPVNYQWTDGKLTGVETETDGAKNEAAE